MSLERGLAAPPPVFLSVHGGPDAGPPIRHDFSTNANPLPPLPLLMERLARADRTRYPDPTYAALTEALSQHHGVHARRVLPTAGSSEGIRRLTLAAAQRGRRQVWIPEPGYGDYRAAALALSLPVRTWNEPSALLEGLRREPAAALVWITEPCNPTGGTLPELFWRELAALADQQGAWLALDRAYEPLRLQGQDPVPAAVAQQCWQLFSPNKSLGLTGVRAGYMLAPLQAGLANTNLLLALAASWVVSAEGEALLRALPLPEVQGWLADSRLRLIDWRVKQAALLAELGWAQRQSVVPFWLARPPVPSAALGRCLQQLREQGIKLRDAQSFGLQGWVRLSTQHPEAQAALAEGWRAHMARPGAQWSTSTIQSTF